MWTLPDLLTLADGSRLENAGQWNAQKEYMKKVLQEQFYGEMPPAPGNMRSTCVRSDSFAEGDGIFEVYAASFGPDHRLEMDIYVMRPNREGRSAPFVMTAGFVKKEIAEMIVRKGFSIVTFDMSKVCPDIPEYETSLLYQTYPEYSWKVIAMWGWLQSRVIDWLETTDLFDLNKIAVTGHSRYGKSSICCAIYDERVQICAPCGSGCGGMGSLRVAGSREGAETGFYETLGFLLNNFPQWFMKGLTSYGKAEINAHYRENELPFDANWLGACIAPRGLLIMEGLDDSWSNPYGTFQTWKSVNRLYEVIDTPEHCAIHFREKGHEFNLTDWTVLADFADVYFNGAEKKTPYKTDVPAEDFGESMKRAFAGARIRPDRWLFEKKDN